MGDLEMKRNVKEWVVNQAIKLAKKSVEDEHKYQWEQVNDIAQIKLAQDGDSYLIEAIIDYLELL